MRSELKRLVASILAVCMMASVMSPVMAADDLAVVTPDASVSTDAPASSEESSEPTEVPASSEESSEPTSVPASSEESSEPTSVPASSEESSEPTSVPASSEESSEPTSVPASSEESSEPTSVPASSEVAEEEETSEEQVEVYAQAEAPTIPGFTQFTRDKIDTKKQYLVVARDKKNGDTYALYLSQMGTGVTPGSLGTKGSVAAKLDFTGDEVKGVHVANNSALNLEDLLIEINAENGGYTFHNAKNNLYLDLGGHMTSSQKNTLSVSKKGSDAWKIQVGGRFLDLNINGDGGKYTNNVTDFWGPADNTGYAGGYNIYMYSKNEVLTDTALDIDGYTQVLNNNFENGEYVLVGTKDKKFQVLNTASANNATEGTRDENGFLVSPETALNGAVLSLTKAGNGVYLSTMGKDGTATYLTLKDGKVFGSATPVLLTLTDKGNGVYTVSNGTETLSLDNGAFASNGTAANIQLYKKDSKVELAQDKATIDKEFGAVLKLNTEPTWIYTDATGAHAPQVKWTIKQGDDVVKLDGNKLIALKESGAAVVTGSVYYTADFSVAVGDVAVTVTPVEGPIKGTTSKQPFIHGQPENCNNFRIPSMITLSNGWLVAAADARWQTAADSPQNLDTMVSVSKDGGETWEYEVVNYFDDMVNTKTGQDSASFIDPSLIQGKDGKVYMVVDACPSYVGLMYGNRMGHESKGFDDQGRMLVTKGQAGGDASRSKKDYTYRVDKTSVEVSVGNTTLKLFPITTENGDKTGTWVDAELNLYNWDGANGAVTKVMCNQIGSGKQVHSNLFYRNSEWKAYPVFYIMLRTANVTNDGLEWGDPQFLNIKLSENESFTGVCPGRGTVTTVNGKERILFPVYDNAKGNEFASVVYSDDNGATWHRGQHSDQVSGVSKTSESQIVNMPNGGLRMYSRNLAGQISYSDSYDGGATWGTSVKDGALNYVGNCMVSFINLDGSVKDANGNVYGNLIAASYPTGKSNGRTDGALRIGSMNASTGSVTWLNSDEVDYPGAYGYSCLTQKKDGNGMALLYEGPGNGGATISYANHTVEEILGDGWTYSTKNIADQGDGLSGVTQVQPYIPEETGHSRRFRIPALDTLSNGWILSAADARWGSTMDAASNLDGLVSLSKDDGKTWEWQMINHFVDYPDQTTGAPRQSASFIDPALIQSEDGTIYMVVDACPAYVGLQNGGFAANQSTGFNADGNIIIAKGTAGAAASKKVKDYTYYIDSKAGVSATVDGETVKLFPIKDAGNKETGNWVDAEYNLYTKDGETFAKSMCKQAITGKPVHNNVFYSQSEWKIYPTFHIWLRKATVTETGLTWSDPQILNIKKSGEGFVGVCPGRGLTVKLDDGTERLMFQVYDNATGQERASTIYTDDHGATWHRGEHVTNNVGKSSESQTILLPNGDIRIYCRNNIGEISYADSKDHGVTWGESHVDKALPYVGNCMVSFINVDGTLVGPNGQVYDNLVMASYPRGPQRREGVLRVGSINAQTNEVTWLNDDTIRYPGSYLYSCLTQENGNDMGLLYEKEDTEYGVGNILYDSMNLTDLMGEGWNYMTTSPNAAPKLDVTMSANSLMVGDTVTVKADVTEVPARMQAEMKWTLTGDNDVEVATLDKTTTANGEAVTLTGVAVGKATLNVSTVVEVNGEKLNLSRSYRVYVSDENTVTLPDEYDQNGLTGERRVYQKDTNGIDNDTYALYDVHDARILYYEKNKDTTDQVGGSTNGNELTLNGGFPGTRQTWKLNKTDKGYTIESCDQAGKYLNVTGTGYNKLPVTTTPCYFDITPAEGGNTYYISTKVGDQTYYVDWNNKFGATTEKKAGIAFFKDTTFTALDTTGLNALIQDVKGLDETNYTVESWNALKTALAEAEKVAAMNGQKFEVGSQEAENALKTVENATLNLYNAKQALKLVEYTVTYKITGEFFADEAFATQKYTMGQAIAAPEAAAHEGYTFSGWQNLPETMPKGDIVVTGSYTKTEYTVTYKITGEFFADEAFATQTYTMGDTITAPKATAHEGYTFSGWQNLPETMPAGNVVVTGSYTKNAAPNPDKPDTDNGSNNNNAPAPAPTAAPTPVPSASAQTGDAFPLAALAAVVAACGAGLVALFRKKKED